MTAIVDPRRLAARHFLLVNRLAENVLSERDRKGKLRGLRSRLREAPVLLLDVGLPGLLAFYASKAESTELLEDLYKALKSLNEESQDKTASSPLGKLVEELKELKSKADNNDNYKKKLSDELGGGEGKGYLAALAMIAAFLEAVGGLRCQDSMERLIERIACTIDALLEEPGLAAGLQGAVLDYLEYAKRLVEAVSGGD